MTNTLGSMLGLFDVPESQVILAEICDAYGIDPALIGNLITLEQDFAGMQRRRGIFDEIDALLESVPQATS